MGRTIKVGARASALSRWQANRVIEELQARGYQAEFIPVTTQGDIDRKTPLYAMRERGVFVKALEQALLEGKIDCAVHSAKDVPTDLPEGCVIPAYLQRDDPRDYCICNADSIEEIQPNATIGTGSLRRRAFLQRIRSDFEFKPLRGNIETRIQKWRDGLFDAILMSASALHRLQYTLPGFYLDPKIFPPAPAQGVICIETRKDADIAEIVRQLNDPVTEEAVVAERKILEKVGGICTLPFGCYVYRMGNCWNCVALLIKDGQARFFSDSAQTLDELIRSAYHAFQR